MSVVYYHLVTAISLFLTFLAEVVTVINDKISVLIYEYFTSCIKYECWIITLFVCILHQTAGESWCQDLVIQTYQSGIVCLVRLLLGNTIDGTACQV